MILLDTCVLLWLAADQSKLSLKARELLGKSSGELVVSAISAFEIGLKHSKNKLRLPKSPDVWFHEALSFYDLRAIPITSEIAARSTLLPKLHADPCDRFLIATAQLGKYRLMTSDQSIAAYPDVDVIW